MNTSGRLSPRLAEAGQERDPASRATKSSYGSPNDSAVWLKPSRLSLEGESSRLTDIWQSSHDMSSSFSRMVDVSSSFSKIVDLDALEGTSDGQMVRAVSAASLVSEKSLMLADGDTVPLSPSNLKAFHHIPDSVWVMCLISMLCQFSQTLSEFVTWFVLETRGWTKDYTPMYYGACIAIMTLFPVLMNPIWGHFSERYGVRNVIRVALMLSAVGIAIMAFTSEAALYPLGILLESSQGVRPLRTAYIAVVTHPSVRTQAMAFQNLFTDSMRIVAILVTKVWDLLGPTPDEPWVLLGVELDTHALSLLTAWTANILNVGILTFFFQEVSEEKKLLRQNSPTAHVELTRLIYVDLGNGGHQPVDSRMYANSMLCIFSLVCLLHQMSCGFFFVCNMPVLAKHFQLQGDAIQDAKLFQDLLPMPAPLLVAYLSKHMQDRTLLVIGFCISGIGMAIFALPPTDHVLRPIFGLMLINWSQAFFYTTMFSLFSKIMGPMSTGYRLALMASAAGLGTSIGTFVSSAAEYYGTFTFCLGVVPSALAMVIMAGPWFYPYLQPDHPVTRTILEHWRHECKYKRPARFSNVSGGGG
uniref:Major facilitator superfamily (MFS) profile domain-containing protein n=1 Tax=Eutreptiella gymnastica TaxID=73025 RepID=A0A7S1NCL5_9EUGL|mmetsp:Transcript_16014/g.28378  ORF Transcript_16014/g.28378 Transcript_16014/m.28378 type:complete len:585 (+) Transcript_16014:123-1877(+)